MADNQNLNYYPSLGILKKVKVLVPHSLSKQFRAVAKILAVGLGSPLQPTFQRELQIPHTKHSS